MLNDNEKFSLKYNDNVTADYDRSRLQYTFDFIYLVLKRGANIDSAVRGVANEYELSQDDLMDYLVENKYILNKTKPDEIKELLKQYNTKSLKKILKKHGLKASGKRKRIEERIIKNHLVGNDYYLSSKSRVFYKNKKRRMRIFDDYLSDHYYFNEFNDYYMDNYRKKEAKIPIEYIKKHISKATEEKNHKNYACNTYIMIEHYHDKDNPRKMLEYVLKNYCMNLNPVWKIDSLSEHGGFPINIYDYLIYLQEKLSKNIIISNYYLVWDSFNFDRIIVPKYEGYRVLKDILHLKDYHRITQDLIDRFYGNDDLKIKKITQKTLFDF